MSLTKLPKELLTAICHYLFPDYPSNDHLPVQALASLAHTCKVMNDISVPILYRRIRVGRTGNTITCARTLLERPDLAQCVRVVEIYGRDRRFPPPQFDFELMARILTKLSVDLPPSLNIADLKSEEFHAHILLMLTPEAERVHYRLHPQDPGVDHRDKLEMSNTMQATTGIIPLLENVKHVDFEARQASYDSQLFRQALLLERFQMQCIASIVGIPDECYTHLNTLSLTNSSIKPEVLLELLQELPRLERFAFRSVRRRDKNTTRPHEVMGVLMLTCMDRLKRLDLDFSDGETGRQRLGNDYDFRGFTALEELALDYEALTGKKARGLCATKPSPFLIDMLPQQIKSLDIHGWEPSEKNGRRPTRSGRSPISRSLIRHLLQEREHFPEQFPDLELVRLNGKEMYCREGATAHRPLPLDFDQYDAFLS
ncbi:uncharacterized protein E0L32_009451 [Thyridium curvatum]|uniref:Uncharacterized protein n=1 Tax=Thyridium curvatum TaxID=1093900 RepID=A0A507APT2_9PEZI|nr:uncharacterized protein E0L32_009451 [Thyridium curvatum]TPX09407.1 hypothetical protein E0L32_009451 [Thyridium curvatum]